MVVENSMTEDSQGIKHSVAKSNVTKSNATKPSQFDSYYSEERYNRLKQFIESAFVNHKVSIESLAGDASFRRYHRVYLGAPIDTSKSPQNYDASYIVMDAPPDLESIESFVRINLLMEMRVNVPTLFAKDIKQGFLLMQDFGNVEFAHLLADAAKEKDASKIDQLYYWAMNTLINLQSLPLDLAKHSFHVQHYDDAKLETEMNLFSEWFLPYIGVALDDKTDKLWHDFKQALISQILQQPQVVVHRDYHSRNLMQDQYHSDVLGVIDFQDAVIGAYTYDLVSLVRDAYVDWDEATVNRWIAYFWQQLQQKPTSYHSSNRTVATSANASKKGEEGQNNLTAFTVDVNIMGIQRHLKVLGIFIRLAQRDGKTRYLQDIPKVWRDLMVEFDWLASNADAETHQLLQPMQRWLTQDIAPKFKRVFAI